MMEIKSLKGGRIIGVKPDELKLSPRASKPKIRLESPGSIEGSVGFYQQMVECAKREQGLPEPSHIEVLIREFQTEIYLTMRVVPAPGIDVYTLKLDKQTRPAIRGLKALFNEARITLRSDTVYEMETTFAHDDAGLFVAALWSGARAITRPEKRRDEAAAGQQS